MKPMVLVILILALLAIIFFTGVGVGALGKRREAKADDPPPWLTGLESLLPGSDLKLDEITATPPSAFNPATGLVQVVGTVKLEIARGDAEVRHAHIIDGNGVVVTFQPEDDRFATIKNKGATHAKPLRLCIPKKGATVTITAVGPGAGSATIKPGKPK